MIEICKHTDIPVVGAPAVNCAVAVLYSASVTQDSLGRQVRRPRAIAMTQSRYEILEGNNITNKAPSQFLPLLLLLLRVALYVYRRARLAYTRDLISRFVTLTALALYAYSCMPLRCLPLRLHRLCFLYPQQRPFLQNNFVFFSFEAFCSMCILRRACIDKTQAILVYEKI